MAAANAQLQTAARLIGENRNADALPILQTLLAATPRASDARRLLALALQRLGDLAGAEGELRTGLKLDKGASAISVALAELLCRTGRRDEAERVLRAARTMDRRAPQVCVALAELMMADGRAAEALQVTAPLVAGASPDHATLAQHAAALKALGRLEEALAAHERAATLNPSSIVAHHNLASTLGDLSAFARAEASAREAFARGGDAPETWLVYARALFGQNRLDEAEAAFRQAIARRPHAPEAHRDLAQLIWMRTENAGLAVATLDQAIAAHPRAHALAEVKATTLNYAGDPSGAYAALRQALVHSPNAASLHTAAAHLASVMGQPQTGLRHAETAVALAPDDAGAQNTLCELYLATGEAKAAARLIDRRLAQNPYDQGALAYQAMVWRMLGDPRYGDLFDYAGLVGVSRLDTPDGWSRLESFLADLAVALDRVHAFRTHPLDQSLRHGSQASNLKASEDPVIQAFFQAVDGPIRRRLAALGKGRDPVRSRNTGDYRFQGAWSARLRPGGFHTDHIHQKGWLSSACYIALPPAVQGSQTREGWIKFGQPGIATTPPLAAEYFVEPALGRLLLFPSYMWHGTVPFSGDQSRLTVAFDLRPHPTAR